MTGIDNEERQKDITSTEFPHKVRKRWDCYLAPLSGFLSPFGALSLMHDKHKPQRGACVAGTHCGLLSCVLLERHPPPLMLSMLPMPFDGRDRSHTERLPSSTKTQELLISNKDNAEPEQTCLTLCHVTIFSCISAVSKHQ